MKSMIYWVACFIGIVMFIGEGSAECAEVLEQYLPENTLAVCVFPDLEHTVEQFQQTRVAKDMASLPQVRQTLSAIGEAIEQPAGLPFAKLWDIFHASVAIALLDTDAVRLSDAPQPSFHIALLADVTGTREALQQVLQTQIIPGIQAQEPNVEFLVESIQGTDVYIVANRQFQMYYTFINHVWILTFDRATLQAIITAEKHLLTTIPYRDNIMSRLENPQTVRLYIDLQRVWKRLQPYIQQECATPVSLAPPQILHILELSQWHSLFWEISWKNQGGYERLSCTIQPEKTQNSAEHIPDLLHTLWSVGNGPLVSDRLLPDNIVYYGATRVNMQEMWLHFSRLNRTSPSLRQREQFNNWVKRVEETLQLDIHDELLADFGQEAAVAWLPGKFPARASWQHLSPEHIPLVFMIQLHNDQFLDQIVQILSTTVQLSTSSTIVQGVPIRSVQIPGKSVVYTLHAAVLKGFLVLSFSKALIQEVIKMSQDGRTLAEAEPYQAVSASFASQEAYSKGYVNIPQVARLLRRFVNQQRLAAPEEDERIALFQELTPKMEQWPGMMWITTVVEDGFLTESFSPVGGPVSGLIFGWLGSRLLEY